MGHRADMCCEFAMRVSLVLSTHGVILPWHASQTDGFWGEAHARHRSILARTNSWSRNLVRRASYARLGSACSLPVWARGPWFCRRYLR
jgi:hypothetical protein